MSCAEPHKRFNSRATIAELCNVITNLDAENKILSDTVGWMHDTIWEMLRAQRELNDDSAELVEKEMDEQVSGEPASTESESGADAAASLDPSASTRQR